MIQRIMNASVDQPALKCGPVRLGLSANGIMLWALRGSEGEGGGTGGEGSGSGDGTGGGSGSGGGSGTDGGAGGGTGGGEGGENNSGGDTPVTKEEFEALKARMQAADRRAQAAEDKVKEHERASLSETEKKDADLKAATERVSALEQEIKDLKVNNAFLSANDVKWHDAEAALKMADLSGVLSDDGTVDTKALKKALEDLSKSKPFLVNSQGGEGGSGGQNNGGGGGAPSGGNVGGGGKKGGSGLSEEELLRKYPALRR